MFNQEQVQVLNQQLDSNRVKSRSKGNINLSYLEGFDIIETANKIFGYGNWSYSIDKLDYLSTEQNQNQNFVIAYKAIVKVIIFDKEHIQSISRTDVGTGTGISKTQAEAHEGATKEAVTDALKRAMRSFGNQFGLSLYDKSKNHHNSQQQNKVQHNYTHQNNAPVNNTNQEQYNPSQNQQVQSSYQHQQDFSQLTNLGLQVMQQGENLIVMGNNVFENKDAIKAHGFRWDGQNRTWYMQLRQAA